MAALLSRRDFIANTVRLAVAGAVVPAALAHALPVLAPDSLASTGPAPLFLRDKATNAKIPVTLSMLAGDAPVVLTAEWNFLPAVVYKVPTATLRGAAVKRRYNTGQHAVAHPTEPDHCLLVYEGQCKHLGCTVGFAPELGPSKDVEDYGVGAVRDGRIECPCHKGQYDLYDMARNIPATPPPEPLNVLRFGIVDWEDPRTQIIHRDVIFAFQKLVQTDHRGADREGDGAPFALAETAEEAEAALP